MAWCEHVKGKDLTEQVMMNDGFFLGYHIFNETCFSNCRPSKKSTLDKDSMSQILYVGFIHGCIDPCTRQDGFQKAPGPSSVIAAMIAHAPGLPSVPFVCLPSLSTLSYLRYPIQSI